MNVIQYGTKSVRPVYQLKTIEPNSESLLSTVLTLICLVSSLTLAYMIFA